MAVRDHARLPLRRDLFAAERGASRKKWTGKLPVALIYPNSYPVGMANLGMQLVYHLLNQEDSLVAERFFAAEDGPPLSLESGRPLADFPIIMASVSFEEDLPNLAAMLVQGGVETLAARRKATISSASPLVVIGGVALSVNPEVAAPFADLLVIGEAEAVLPRLIEMLWEDLHEPRLELLAALCRALPGCYPPALYEAVYAQGRFLGHRPLADNLPARIQRAFPENLDEAGYSRLLSPHCEFANLFLIEMGRGCSRACRFCAAGFVYRPPRQWTEEAIAAALAAKPAGVDRVGLLGMETAPPKTLDRLTRTLAGENCDLSFSSLRADALSDSLLELLAGSHLKSAAIAPDGCSERLRRVINKGLSEEALLAAAGRLATSGIVKLKLYWMVGLPTENDDDLYEAARLVEKIKAAIDPLGRARGRVCEISLSVNCFVPKPWTPLQYHIFGGEPDPKNAVAELRRRLHLLRRAVRGLANVRFRHDKPENILWQAVLAKGDRRLAPVLLDMAVSGRPWTQAMKRHGLAVADYAAATGDADTVFPWMILDHGLKDGYLWQE
ncbi:MAG: radical SAM protein, partial [Desulfobulbaceae bacterium]|nr:radical SAM protein [Desulfobulbaceae bacterium]